MVFGEEKPGSERGGSAQPPANTMPAHPQSPTVPDAIQASRPQLRAWAARRLPAEHPELATAVQQLVKHKTSPATIELAFFSATGDRPLAKVARYYAEAIINDKETVI